MLDVDMKEKASLISKAPAVARISNSSSKKYVYYFQRGKTIFKLQLNGSYTIYIYHRYTHWLTEAEGRRQKKYNFSICILKDPE